MPDDPMFAPLSSEDLAAAAAHASTKTSKPIPIIPVPDDASPFQWRHPRFGEPVAIWPYLDSDGRVVVYAARVEYEQAGELKKSVYPVCHCRINRPDGH